MRGGYSLPTPPHNYLLYDSLNKFAHVIIESRLYYPIKLIVQLMICLSINRNK